MTTIEQLQALEALRINGTLTEAEFQREKAKVLGHDVGTSIGQVKRPWWRLNALQWVALSLLLLIGGSIFLQSLPNRFNLKDRGLIGNMLSPNPVVVEFHFEDGNSTIWDFKRTIVGTIRNKGADGFVNINAHITQGSKEFNRNDRLYLNHEEERTVRYEFDEVEAGNGVMHGNLKAFTLPY